MKLCGSELGQRLGMLELYENHFRIRVVAFENQAYERAFMDQGDKIGFVRSCLIPFGPRNANCLIVM